MYIYSLVKDILQTYETMDLYSNISQPQWNCLFPHPFTMLLSGASNSEKTVCFLTFLEKHKYLIYPPPKKLVVAYKHFQPMYNEFNKHIETKFIQGVPTEEQVQGADLLFIDDLMSEIDKCIEFFTVFSHHMKISVVFITQNLYQKGLRTLSLNANYLVIFNNPRDSSQMKVLANQLEPSDSKLVTEAYETATNKAHGYLVINCRQKTDKLFKYRDNIDVFDNCSIFVSKKWLEKYKKTKVLTAPYIDTLVRLINSGLSLVEAINTAHKMLL